ncbi:MAG TPA: 23S rRNA (pseudouridine(1915)-N(3))-methyltransferase RlmH [Candidatus Saccharimonadales bacterium]|nr:23S rRNA (pseudouridine(1915)-N(3))-methyltransferase RlmH [Candidatus Saccharimonadales bacterium]
MRFHFITVGEPKLDYARRGWDEYYKRLGRFHQLRTTRIDDKHANDTSLLHAADRAYLMPLDLEGKEFSSPQLAKQLDSLATNGTSEIVFLIGGPEGFGDAIRQRADCLWKLSDLTLPHDLAMVVMLEALYRASTITAGLPYHR